MRDAAACLLPIAMLAVLNLTDCVRHAETLPPPGPFVSERAAAVAIESECKTKKPDGSIEIVTSWGSGVAFGTRYVLTAYHVVPIECGDRGTMIATLATGERYRVRLQAALVDADLARLVVEKGEFPREYPIRLRRATEKATVCIVAGRPERDVVCGRVYDTSHDDPGDIRHTARTIPGNSGSGLYDAASGDLVGIVSWREYAGGRAGSLLRVDWMVDL